jgi:hypothetical protein
MGAALRPEETSNAFLPGGRPFAGSGLVFQELLPLSWLPGPLAEGLELARLNADNHQLLGAEASLDEVRIHDALKDESPALVSELQRLEFKMNILLRLTAQLAVQHQALPARQLVRLSSRGMEWEGLAAVPAGTTGLLKLYVNAALPQPLHLPCVATGEGIGESARAARLRFVGVSDAVTEQLEKLIFRHHRRLIAGAKQAKT